MTYIEKSKELYIDFYENLWFTDEKDRHLNAKECALICCDKIIEGAKELEFTVLHTNYGQKLIDINGEIISKYTDFVLYYSRVKQEIELL